MFKISSVSLVVALASISALAAPQVSNHERALQKASKWSDITAQLENRLPSNVVKEFADFAKGEEFPSTRRIKNKLVITESDGTKVVIEYKKDGVVSLNGKEWKLRPLATVEEEVTRLALFISGEKKAEAGLFGLVPAAQAGGANGMGAAAAAFAGANSWKSEYCRENSVTKDLNEFCMTAAVGTQLHLASSNKAESDDVDEKEIYLPLRLKCPKKNKNTMEVLFKNGNGFHKRAKIQYVDDMAKIVKIEISEPGKKFEVDTYVDFETVEDDRVKGVAVEAVTVLSPLKDRVCDGGEEMIKRYEAKLAANREKMSDSKKASRIDDGKKSVEL